MFGGVARRAPVVGACGQALLHPGGQAGCVHRQRRGQQARQPHCGRIGPLLPAGAALRVALAGQQHGGKAIGPADGVAALEEPQQRVGAQRAAGVDVAVFTRHHVGQLAAFNGHLQPHGQRRAQPRAARLVAVVARPLVGRRRSLAQIVHQAGPAHRQRRGQVRCGVQHQQQVRAGVDLGVVLGALWHAPEPVDLGHQPRQRAAAAQHLEHPARPRRHEAPRQLLPHPLGHQRVDLAVGHHAAQQRHRFGCHGEVGKTRRQPRQPQQAHRVFDKGLGHVAQHARAQVGLAAVGVDERTVLSTCDGVDGEVAARQVVFQRHVGRGVDRETGVAGAGLALGAGQRHFFMGLRMQKNREVFAHGPVAQVHQLLRRGTDDDPVAVGGGHSQQLVAHGATHDVEAGRAGAAHGISGVCGRALRNPGNPVRPARR